MAICLQNEIMTASVAFGTYVISRLTLALLEDTGYINYVYVIMYVCDGKCGVQHVSCS